MEVSIISVPYSGTNFAATLFINEGFERINLTDTPETGKSVRVAHCVNPLEVKDPYILVFRHPYLVEESYRRKNRNPAKGRRAFHNLVELSSGTDLFLCVDSPHREAQLDKIRDRLGLKLETNWEIVSSKSDTHDIPISNLTPSERAQDLVKLHSGFLSEFYELV